MTAVGNSSYVRLHRKIADILNIVSGRGQNVHTSRRSFVSIIILTYAMLVFRGVLKSDHCVPMESATRGKWIVPKTIATPESLCAAQENSAICFDRQRFHGRRQYWGPMFSVLAHPVGKPEVGLHVVRTWHFAKTVGSAALEIP